MSQYTVFISMIVAMAVTFFMVPVIIHLSKKLNKFDLPDEGQSSDETQRRVHTIPTPRLGGAGMILGYFASCFFWEGPNVSYALALSSLPIFVLGFLDDLYSLSARLRLLLQILYCSAVVWYFGLAIESLYLTHNIQIPLGPFGGFFSVLLFIGAINAINLCDGLDGLAGGLSLIGLILFSLSYFLVFKDIAYPALILGPVVACIIGFLRYNTYPAKIFMGDGGSNWLGYLIGLSLIFILGRFKIDSLHEQVIHFGDNKFVPFIIPIACLAIPILDAAVVLMKRILRGQKLTNPDQTHFHHVLLRSGFSHSSSVLTIYFIAISFGFFAQIPILYPSRNLSPILFLILALLVLLLSKGTKLAPKIFERVNYFWRELKINPALRPYLHTSINALFAINRYLIYFILCGIPLFSGVPPVSLGYFCLFALLLIGISLFPISEKTFFSSFTLSLASLTLLMAINSNSIHIELMGELIKIQSIYNFLFILLVGVESALLLATLKRQALAIAPTDLLIVILPVCLLFIPEPYNSELKMNIISIRSLALFIAIRLAIGQEKSNTRRFSVVCGLGLMWLALVGLLGLRVVY